MKSSLKIMLSILLIVSPLTSFAQWRFKAKVVSTSCHGDKITAAVTAGAVEGQCNHLNSIEFKTEKECNEARKDFLSWNKNKDCRIVVKASKCTCPCQKDSDSASSDKDDPEDSSPSSSEEVYYNNLHNKVDYKANAGYEQMQKTQPKGTERLKAGYIPGAKPVSSSDIVGVFSKTRRNSSSTIKLLDEHAVPNTGQAVYLDYDARFDNWKKYEKEREKRRREKEVKKRQVEKIIWDKITATMDDGQVAALKYYLTENNETIYSPGEEGEKREIIKELPHAVKETEDYYAFLSDDGNKIFVVDKKMPMLITFSFDEHQWKDDNLYNEIKNGTLKDSYDFESNESAKLDLIDGRNIAELAPHAKVNLQLALIDNSSTLKTNFYYFPQTKTVLPGVKATPVVNIGGGLSAGGKVSAGATAQASLLYPSFSIQGEAKASEIELQENVTLGAVVKYGDKYYLSSANLSGEMGVGYTVKKKAGISITKDADIIKNSSKLESDNDWGGEI